LRSDTAIILFTGNLSVNSTCNNAGHTNA